MDKSAAEAVLRSGTIVDSWTSEGNRIFLVRFAKKTYKISIRCLGDITEVKEVV